MLYIHIPFCKTRCHYCDFFSSTHHVQKALYVKALCREITLRSNELEGNMLSSIYLGGGTPSQLSREELHLIFDSIAQNFDLSRCTEITMEANPDDLTESYIAELTQLPINRLSIGIQSFNDDQLKLLNRRHTAQKAIEAIQKCKQFGFENISIDLMYGLPNQTIEGWKQSLHTAIELGVPHLSAYHLTYEVGTVLDSYLKQGKIKECNEELSIEFFETLIDTYTNAGYEHYEISNFALPQRYAQHNTGYWQNKPYIGVGAAAHSYNGNIRAWNVSDVAKYIALIDNGSAQESCEKLTLIDKYNETIITALRTQWGINLTTLSTPFYEYCLQQSQEYLSSHLLQLSNNHLKLTRKGIFIADGIIERLMYEE